MNGSHSYDEGVLDLNKNCCGNQQIGLAETPHGPVDKCLSCGTLH